MSRGPIQEVEHKRRLPLQALLPALAIFAVLVVLLWSNARLYELRQENLALEEELKQRRTELAELEDTQDLRQRAETLGLQEIDPKAVRELHIRRRGGNIRDV